MFCFILSISYDSSWRVATAAFQPVRKVQPNITSSHCDRQPTSSHHHQHSVDMCCWLLLVPCQNRLYRSFFSGKKQWNRIMAVGERITVRESPYGRPSAFFAIVFSHICVHLKTETEEESIIATYLIRGVGHQSITSSVITNNRSLVVSCLIKDHWIHNK